ncbi:hypothetical protein [Paucilactobacillus nenjiangensis]|uniref:Uncharacterized protein n=1 Tax=Paucilactobacillus nenjiangensis TaxID=1296540 RepID=A0A5P1WZS3_9LACO|nr:hypothetical protein [Paucilactobacillus nenjiangensis]QER66655.1 hypothetical protein F0161_01415 [Paucilactobacillus nenjiangensis]
MKKCKNDDLHTIGIGVALISAALIIGPLVQVMYGHKLSFYFFDVLHGWAAFAACFAIFLIGLAMTFMTEKITPKHRDKKETKETTDDKNQEK